MISRRVVFRPYQPDKGAGKDFHKKQVEERITKEEAKKAPFLNPDCQPQKHPMKKDKEGRAWESDN